MSAANVLCLDKFQDEELSDASTTDPTQVPEVVVFFPHAWLFWFWYVSLIQYSDRSL